MLRHLTATQCEHASDVFMPKSLLPGAAQSWYTPGGNIPDVRGNAIEQAKSREEQHHHGQRRRAHPQQVRGTEEGHISPWSDIQTLDIKQRPSTSRRSNPLRDLTSVRCLIGFGSASDITSRRSTSKCRFAAHQHASTSRPTTTLSLGKVVWADNVKVSPIKCATLPAPRTQPHPQ